MDRTTAAIKAYCERSSFKLGSAERPGSYPTAETLAAFVDDRLNGAELERMLAYLGTNPDAQTLVIRIRELLATQHESLGQAVPPAVLDRAKSLGSGISGRRKPPQRPYWMVWLLLAIAAFAGSFLVPGRYVQFVAAGVLFGVKAIVDQKAAKTQIFIYKALEDAEKSHLHGR